MPPFPPTTKYLLIACVAIFCIGTLVPPGWFAWLALWPVASGNFLPWQVITYALLHGDTAHLFFNMLGLWMFGAELETLWGRKRFLHYIVACVLSAAAAQLLVTALMGSRAPTVGASGAIYGLLLAYAILFPNRIIYYFIFPIPVRIYVLLAGLLVLYESARGGGGVAHFAHLGGLIFGYLYLSMGRGGPWAEIKYRYVKWRMNRLRKRFDVHQGGKRWDSRVH
jgi:membrane associated rhomboid family serine protease